MHRRSVTTLATALLAAALVVGAPTTSRADNDSILTLGVGAGVGYRHAAGPGEDAAMEFINQASVRVKLLWILGADLSVDLAHDTALTEPEANRLRYAAKMRLTGLFYPIPTSVFELYLGLGLGASGVSELFQVTSEGNSYHVGGGFEIHVNDHFTIDTSFYMIVPGYSSLRTHFEQLALEVVEGAEQDILEGGDPPGSIDDLPIPDITIGDYVTPTNYEVMLRIFLFL